MSQLLQAVDGNCVEDLRRYLPHATVFTATYVLVHAAHTGKAACVAELLPASDPQSANNTPLIVAVERERLDCVKLLLPVSDPTARGNRALYLSVELENYDLFCLLYPVSNVQALCAICSDEHIAPKWKTTWNDFEARYQRDLLHQQVKTPSSSSRKKI